MRALHFAHNDTNHYQERALSSFWIWHRIALQEARATRGDLTLALAYSAFSLHFLEDFLAPGHVRTPRPDLHDAAAMKIHDWFNGLGQIFKVRNLDDLRPPFLEPRVLRGLEGNPNLFLLGDERLGRPESNVLQAPFIAAVVGRAIADVFEGYLDGACPEGQRYSKIQVRNHFEGDWEWRTYDAQADEQKTLSPLACIHYGCYEQVLETHSFDFRPIFVAEAGAQALLSVDTTSRAQSELSVGAIWLLSPPKGWRTGVIKPPIQLLGGVEWNHVFGRAYADGIRARLYFPITALDLQLTASATYLWYGGDFSGDQRLGWDAGFQFGYGLLFAGINVGRQSVLNEMNDRLTPAWTLTGNVTVMLSPSIISKLLKPDRGVTFTH
jgi:hypothetical protein